MSPESHESRNQDFESLLDKPSLTKEEQALLEMEMILASMNVPETFLPASRISLFNFLIVNPYNTSEEFKERLDRELKKLYKYANKEILYSQNKKIPPIGIELEIPSECLSDSTIDVNKLGDLGIPNGPEANHYAELWEIRNSPTFSASTQSKILEELRKTNLVGSEENLSMHINLGIPADIDKKNGNNIYKTTSTSTFIDASTLAFVSPERLSNRKSLGVYTVKNTSIENISDRKNQFRLELRTHEFNDYTAYRAMNDIQLVSVCYFEYIRSITDNNVNEKLITCWQKLNTEFKEIVDRYRLPNDELGAFDTDYKKLKKILWDKPDIQKEVRFVYSECAREVKAILFPNQDFDAEE